MAAISFKIDDAGVQQAFEKLSVAQTRNILRAGARKGILEIRKQAVKNYRREFKKSDKFRAIWAKNYARKNRLGAYISLHKLNPKFELENPLLLTWLNVGTEERYIKSYHRTKPVKRKVSAKTTEEGGKDTKKRWYRGKVKPYGFLTRAIDQMEMKAFIVCENYIHTAINKKAQKLGLSN